MRPIGQAVSVRPAFMDGIPTNDREQPPQRGRRALLCHFSRAVTAHPFNPGCRDGNRAAPSRWRDQARNCKTIAQGANRPAFVMWLCVPSARAARRTFSGTRGTFSGRTFAAYQHRLTNWQGIGLDLAFCEVLRTAPQSTYREVVAAKSATGLGIPNTGAYSAAHEARRFFCARVSTGRCRSTASMVDGAREPQGSPVLCRYSNRVPSATPFGIGLTDSTTSQESTR